MCLFLFHCFTWQGLACSWKTRAIARRARFHLVRLVLQRFATALVGYVGGNFLTQSTVVATPALNFPSNNSKQLMLFFLTDRKPDLFFFIPVKSGGVGFAPAQTFLMLRNLLPLCTFTHVSLGGVGGVLTFV